jgi:spore coat polysaccharide biosynthesis protein SpsF
MSRKPRNCAEAYSTYAAQEIAQADTEIAEKGRFETGTKQLPSWADRISGCPTGKARGTSTLGKCPAFSGHLPKAGGCASATPSGRGPRRRLFMGERFSVDSQERSFMVKVLCIIQAGIQSNPEVNGIAGIGADTVLKEQIRRLKRVLILDDIVVLTSTREEDQRIFRDVSPFGVKVMAGPEHDVLKRLIMCINAHNPSHVLRVTPRSPLLEESWVNHLVIPCLKKDTDYGAMEWDESRIIQECFTRKTLETCHRLAEGPRQRENVTSFIRKRKDLFSILLLRPNLEGWKQDESQDLTLAWL